MLLDLQISPHTQPFAPEHSYTVASQGVASNEWALQTDLTIAAGLAD